MNFGDAVIRRSLRASFLSELCDDRAAQILEFALSLPLLVVFVVGIYDFSGAFTLKQKLTNIARDTARIAAADPANDLVLPTTAQPVSVTDAYQALQGYLVANKIANCGLTPPGSPTDLTWTFSAATCTAGVQTFTINRGYYYSSLGGGALPTTACSNGTVGSGNLAVISTCVSIQYVYQWQFGRVATLIGSTTTLPASITVTAVAMNEN
jgi:Flp pilus assembly protein TadG